MLSISSELFTIHIDSSRPLTRRKSACGNSVLSPEYNSWGIPNPISGIEFGYSNRFRCQIQLREAL